MELDAQERMVIQRWGLPRSLDEEFTKPDDGLRYQRGGLIYRDLHGRYGGRMAGMLPDERAFTDLENGTISVSRRVVYLRWLLSREGDGYRVTVRVDEDALRRWNGANLALVSSRKTPPSCRFFVHGDVVVFFTDLPSLPEDLGLLRMAGRPGELSVPAGQTGIGRVMRRHHRDPGRTSSGSPLRLKRTKPTTPSSRPPSRQFIRGTGYASPASLIPLSRRRTARRHTHNRATRSYCGRREATWV